MNRWIPRLGLSVSLVGLAAAVVVLVAALADTARALIAPEQSAAEADGAWHAYEGWKQKHSPDGVQTCHSSKETSWNVVCTVSDDRWSGPRDVRCDGQRCWLTGQ